MHGCALSVLFPAHYGTHRVAATLYFSGHRLRERGRSCRAFALAECHKIDSHYENGVLTIDIPLSETSQPKKISVKSGQGSQSQQVVGTHHQ